MFAISPQLSKVLLGLLLLLPWFSLQQKTIFPFLVYTGFDGELIILCELLFAILISIFGKHPKVTKQGALLLLTLTCWHLSGLISAVLSDHFHVSLIKQLQYLVHCLFAYSIWVFLRQHGKHQLLAAALVFAFLWAVFSLAYKWINIDDPYLFNWVFGTPFFNHIRHFGFIQIAVLPLLYLPLFNSFQFKNILVLVLLTIFWSSVIWTGSRGTFLSAIIISCIIPFCLNYNKKALFTLFSVAFVFGWLIALQFPVESYVLDPYRLLFLNFENGIESSKQVSSGRTEIWLRILNTMWNRNPLFGLGANSYDLVSPRIWPGTTQAHGGPVQLFTEFGILGFSALLLSFAVCIKIWFQCKATNLQLLSRVAILGICIASVIDGHFYFNFSLLFISTILALSFPFNTKSQQKTNLLAAIFILSIGIGSSLLIQRHWQSYMLQQVPLTDQKQLDTVKEFPSFYSPSAWLTNFNADPHLLQQALKLGQRLGPYRCKYFKQELVLSTENSAGELFLIDMDKACHRKEEHEE